MILFSADLQTVYKRLAARRKENAGEVRQDERCIRNAEVVGSSPTIGPTFEPPEAA